MYVANASLWSSNITLRQSSTYNPLKRIEQPRSHQQAPLPDQTRSTRMRKRANHRRRGRGRSGRSCAVGVPLGHLQRQSNAPGPSQRDIGSIVVQGIGSLSHSQRQIQTNPVWASPRTGPTRANKAIRGENRPRKEGLPKTTIRKESVAPMK